MNLAVISSGIPDTADIVNIYIGWFCLKIMLQEDKFIDI
jgi:hypothetical protein